jgi:hypothetical protein
VVVTDDLSQANDEAEEEVVPQLLRQQQLPLPLLPQQKAKMLLQQSRGDK